MAVFLSLVSEKDIVPVRSLAQASIRPTGNQLRRVWYGVCMMRQWWTDGKGCGFCFVFLVAPITHPCSPRFNLDFDTRCLIDRSRRR